MGICMGGMKYGCEEVGSGYEDVGMVIGIMEYEGWKGMVEAFAKVCVAIAWPCKDGGNGSNGGMNRKW